MENKIKYILIWEYHDCYYHIFDTKEELKKYLKILIKDYKNDSDFHYKVLEGKLIYENN